MKKSKRQFLKLGIGSVAIGLTGRAGAMICEDNETNSVLTPAQPQGPFYPEKVQDDTDNDLTQVRGLVQKAEGEVIIISGSVLDENCQALPGVIVEIWQACHTGRYDHSSDTNDAERDPYFQYWGRDITDEKGQYEFKTIMPGAYPASSDWMRPSHIHCKVQKRGYKELTTQMYFKNSEHLNTDRIYLWIPESERENVVIDSQMDENIKLRKGKFNVTLEKVL